MPYIIITLDSKYFGKHEIKVATMNSATHALMTDYPEVWKVIQDHIKNELTTIVRLDELARDSRKTT